MDELVRDAQPAASAGPRPAAVIATAGAPLVPPVLGWILAVALSGPPDYPGWPLGLLVIGAVAVPVVAGLMTRVLGSWRLGLLPVLVAGVAGAIFGAWWGGLFAPPAALTSGPASVACVTNLVKGVTYAVVASGAIVLPAVITAWLVRPAGDRRRVALAVVTVPPITVLIGLVLFIAATNLLSRMGPRGCDLIYLG